MGSYFGSIAIWSRLSNWCGLLWLVALVAGPVLGYPPALRIAGFSAAVAAIAFLIVHETLKSRRSKQLLDHFATVAERGRQERLRREYQRYLTAVA
ncbi:hypothetical protein [Microbacterium candidum]|uniref:DUF4229 domain-containing protein n=1 Tax=Microbacterium candidum TaxID=3041922 RepID=A0ABT7MVW6_9MICO|nr:hypothetical protein [Microbacterium sp. ASV49]MDL9978594.1 hypothetical protein [Microbacterium sp. ASV49]